MNTPQGSGGKGLLEKIGGREALKQFADQYEKDKQWIEAHRAQLLESHAEEWVAVYEEDVVGSHSMLDELVEQLHKRDILSARAVIEYITDRKVDMLL